MRINVYAEELIVETEIITKQVTNDRIGSQTFYGIRFYLKSPTDLHSSAGDDDRSAITLWVPWTRAAGNNFTLLKVLFSNLLKATYTAEYEDDKTYRKVGEDK